MTINRKKIFRWLKIFIIIYCGIGIGMYYLQEWIIFHPKKLDSNYTFHFDMPFKEINIPVNETDTINMIQFLPADSVPKGVVVYYHGNKNNVEHYAKYAKNFTKHGYEVWIEDYPGYGKSSGERTEQKLYEQAAQVQRMAAAKYPADKIIIYGRSLGSGLAAYIASLTKNKRLILETPYYSIPAIFDSYTFIYPVNSMINYKIPAYEYLQAVDEPVTILHGTNDWMIPYRCAAKLKKYLKPGDEFVTIENGGHNNLNDFKAFHQVLDSLLK